MVRKAEEINVLEELDFSPKTREYLEKNFYALDEVIMYGRQKAYLIRLKETRHVKKWLMELIEVLEEGGFCYDTQDLARTFNVHRLYRAVYGDVDQFYEGVGDLYVNSEYESVRIITENELRQVQNVIDRLDDEEYMFIVYRYGLSDDNTPHTFEATRYFYNLGKKAAMSIETEALEKLRGRLPQLFDFLT